MGGRLWRGKEGIIVVVSVGKKLVVGGRHETDRGDRRQRMHQGLISYSNHMCKENREGILVEVWRGRMSKLCRDGILRSEVNSRMVLESWLEISSRGRHQDIWR